MVGTQFSELTSGSFFGGTGYFWIFAGRQILRIGYLLFVKFSDIGYFVRFGSLRNQSLFQSFLGQLVFAGCSSDRILFLRIDHYFVQTYWGNFSLLGTIQVLSCLRSLLVTVSVLVERSWWQLLVTRSVVLVQFCTGPGWISCALSETPTGVGALLRCLLVLQVTTLHGVRREVEW